MRHHYLLRYENILMRPLCEADIESLRLWRNDAQKTTYLKKLPFISTEAQLKWYQSDCEDTSAITFAIEETRELNRFIGSVALYDFHADTAECGRILIGDPDAHGRGAGRSAVLLCVHFGFTMLGLNKITSVINSENIASLTIFQHAGFIADNPLAQNSGNLVFQCPKHTFYEKHSFSELCIADAT